MRHGPDPYTQALADLDELLDRRDADLTGWVLEAARRVDLIGSAGRSLVAAAHAVLTYGLSDANRDRLRNAARQFVEVTK